MQNDSLRFDASRVPAVTSRLNAAIASLNRDLSNLRFGGRLNEAWLGDEASAQVAAHYNNVAIDGHGSALGALEKLRDHLVDVVKQLNATAAEYAASDTTAAARFPATH